MAVRFVRSSKFGYRLQAFNAGGNIISDSLKPVKESVLSMLHLPLENGESKSENGECKNENPRNVEDASSPQANNIKQPEGNDKYPAPSTPQLKQGARLLDDNDCHENADCSTEKDDIDAETKFVETTNNNMIVEVKLLEEENHSPAEIIVKDEKDGSDSLKTECCGTYPNSNDKDSCKDSNNNVVIAENPSKVSGLHNSSGNKANRKKMKVINLISKFMFSIFRLISLINILKNCVVLHYMLTFL